MHRDNATLIACIGMYCRHVLCLPHTVQVWGIVYLCIGLSTTFFQINERLHTFCFYIPRHIGAEWQKENRYEETIFYYCHIMCSILLVVQ